MIKPYYEQSGVTIYHGDCRDVLPTLSRCSLLLTDPPYGIGGDTTIHCTKPSRPNTYRFGPKYEIGTWDAARPSASVFDTMLALTDHQIIWGGNYFADFLPPSRGWLFWDKQFEHTTNLSHGELAWTSFDQRLMKFTLSSKAETNGGRFREHPTQKPLALIRWCLGLAPAAAYVLDPFMGSGSVLVAAKQRGCKSIGIEIEERYCEIAATRLQQEAFDFGFTEAVDHPLPLDAVDPAEGIA